MKHIKYLAVGAFVISLFLSFWFSVIYSAYNYPIESFKVFASLIVIVSSYKAGKEICR